MNEITFTATQNLTTRHPTFTVNVEYKVSAEVHEDIVFITYLSVAIHSDQMITGNIFEPLAVPLESSPRTEDQTFLEWLKDAAREAHHKQKSKP